MRLLKKLYEISSPSEHEKRMRKFIISILRGADIPYYVYKIGNVYATKGKSKTYPCIVSHIDEVHDFHKKGYEIVVHGDVIFGLNANTMSYEGIGADDKNGIWVCLKALSEFEVLKCAFFVSEEIGCIGSSDADMEFFKDCRFVLQCDRKGSSDFITCASFTELCSEEFTNAVEMDKFGYKEANGMMTDVMTLKGNGLGVSCCNISCGYYNPHTSNEMTRFSELQNCYEFVKHIITNCTSVYSHKHTSYTKSYGSYYQRSVIFSDFNWRKDARTGRWTIDDAPAGMRQTSKEDEEQDAVDEEYVSMASLMEEKALNDPEKFSLEEFITSYSEYYPNLIRSDFERSCTELTGVTY